MERPEMCFIYFFLSQKMWQNKRLISELGRESETNGTNLGGCQRCLQRDAVGGGRVRIANVHICRRCCCPEENMQNENAHTTGSSEWVMRGRELKARHWAAGSASQVSDEGRHFQQVLLVQPSASWLCQCQGGLSREFYQGLISWSFFCNPPPRN